MLMLKSQVRDEMTLRAEADPAQRTDVLILLWRAKKKELDYLMLPLIDSNEPPPPYLLTSAELSIPLNIVIHIVGSRGDVQPFVALGKELQLSGHRVRIATHSAFKGFVEDNGLEFFSIGGDPAELMAFMVKYPGMIPGRQAVLDGEIQTKRKAMAEMFDGCWRSCVEAANGIDEVELNNPPFIANAIIANPPSFAHIHCAEKLRIPLHLMFT